MAAADEALVVDGEHLPLRPRRRLPRRLGVALSVIVIIAALGALPISPTRKWLDQRKTHRENLTELEAVEKANAELEAQIARLQTPDEIERLARERYNYVKAGTQVFAVLPEPAPNPLPNEWPYNLIADLVTLKLNTV